MNLKILLCTFFGTITIVEAQALLPEIAPLAKRHKAETEAVATPKSAAILKVQKRYFVALDSAEKLATSSSQLPLVAAISKDREAVGNGSASSAFPSDLPKTLQSDRRAYFDEVGRILTEAKGRQQRVDADYLRALANLQGRAAANPALATQIKLEKDRILSGVTAGGANAAGTNFTSAVSGAHSKDELHKKIANSKWQMFGNKNFIEPKRPISIGADGSGTWGDSATKWEAIDGKSIKFRYGTITFYDEFRTFMYTEGKFTDYGKRLR